MFTEDIDELGDAFGLCPQLLVVLISEHRHHFLKALHIVVHVLAKAAKGDVFLIDVAFAEAKSLGHTQVEEYLWGHIERQGSQNSSNLSFSCIVQGNSECKGLFGRKGLNVVPTFLFSPCGSWMVVPLEWILYSFLPAIPSFSS